MMSVARDAVRLRRLAAEGLSNVCMAQISSVVSITIARAAPIDPNLPADWQELLLKLEG